MQLNTIKSASDLPFKGVELVKVDTSISEVIIGGKLRVRTGDYGSGLKVLLEVPGETVTRYRVTATLDGFGTKVEHYETAYDASTAERRLSDIGAKAETAEVKVIIDAMGEVIADAEAKAAAPVADDELVPF